jgi:hypothetical protein
VEAKIIAIVIKAVEAIPMEPSVLEERIVAEPAPSKIQVMKPWVTETMVAETRVMKARSSAHATVRRSAADAPAKTAAAGEATVPATTLSECRHYL